MCQLSELQPSCRTDNDTTYYSTQPQACKPAQREPSLALEVLANRLQVRLSDLIPAVLLRVLQCLLAQRLQHGLQRFLQCNDSALTPKRAGHA